MADVETSQLDGLPIANIVLAEIIDEVTNKSYLFDTAEKASAKPDLSKGKEDVLRVSNRIIASNRTDDICIGYQIALNNCVFIPEVMALIDGGTFTANGYEAPPIGVALKRNPFTVNLYCEEKDYDSSTVKFIQFCFKHNKGTPVEFSFEDGKFYVPSFNSVSRPKKGEKPVYINYRDALPTPTPPEQPAG